MRSNVLPRVIGTIAIAILTCREWTVRCEETTVNQTITRLNKKRWKIFPEKKRAATSRAYILFFAITDCNFANIRLSTLQSQIDNPFRIYANLARNIRARQISHRDGEHIYILLPALSEPIRDFLANTLFITFFGATR